MATPRYGVPSVAVGLAIVLLSSGCDRSNSDKVTAPAPPPPVADITRVTDAAMLETYLKAGIRARTASVGIYGEGGPTAVADGGYGDVGAQAYSSTNIQEAGVDEADRVKTDGQRLYVLHRPLDCCNAAGAVLRVMRLSGAPAAGATQQGVLTFDTGVGADGLYLFSAAGGALDRLAVVGSSISTDLNWHATWTWQNGGVDFTVVDVANPAQPVAGTHLHIDGHLVSSRRIGDTLYLVSRHVASVSGYQAYPGTEEAREQNERLLQEAPLAALLPRWRVDGADRGELFAADACYLLPVGQQDYSPDLVTLTAIDLRNPAATPKSACLLGPSETLYASTEAIYLATTRYHYSSGNLATAGYPADMSTDVHKFALTPAGPALRGSANIPGHLGWHQDKKPFRFGEHEGVLRVVTSSGTWGGEVVRLATLAEQDGKLVELAHLPNDQRPATIGKPGEQLYAVRFLGNRGFAVTFRTVDPLYVLDLSDPADPFIAGELQITGYSDYLHPVSETRLLGIGKDAIPADNSGDDNRGAWYQGVKVSVFDISNPAAPSEIDSVVIGKRGTEAGVLYDHHALAWLPADPATNRPARLALPIDLHQTAGDYSSSEPWSWYNWTYRGLYLFDIESAGITPRGSLVVADNAGVSPPTDRVDSDRAVIAGDDVHYVHGAQVWSAAWGDPDSLTAAQ